MAIRKKGKSKKLIVAIILVILIAVAAAAIAYTYKKPSSSSQSLAGVQVGNTFTYSITGSCSNPVPSIDYPGFYQLNQTQYYKVTITGVQGNTVTLKTDWVFNNETDVQQQQTIDLSNGMMTTQEGFWGLYPADLKVSNLIYPYNSTVAVNATITKSYTSGNRALDYYGISTTQAYALDPTQSTQRTLYDEVYFDKQTGMLTNFNEIQEYNNPQLEVEVIYALTNTNVWNV
ncbi:MAG TPA: hypothetical protein VK536_02050 [Candidatus Limnocylindrales bacterium]|nr:hypothetical protein [Candidatus Limnocylindrales bacterium]